MDSNILHYGRSRLMLYGDIVPDVRLQDLSVRSHTHTGEWAKSKWAVWAG
jgi:hypothetical protein